MLATGVVGTVIAALCGFTPVLVVLLATVGLAGLTGYLGYVLLLPALVFFLALTGYALHGRRQERCQPSRPPLANDRSDPPCPSMSSRSPA